MAESISLFSSQIINRRFDDVTLCILKSVMLCKDVKSLMEVKSSLIQFMRSQSLSVLNEIKEKSVDDKLLILDFFVRAFAMIGDVESCLALKYEALLLRDMKSSSFQFLHVSYEEWLNFAEQLIDNGFHSTARQVCENASSSLQKDDFASAEGQFYKRIQRLKDRAVKFAGSGSVQAQAQEYLKRTTVEKGTDCCPFGNEAQCTASVLFRNGIKMRNVRQLRQSKSGQQKS